MELKKMWSFVTVKNMFLLLICFSIIIILKKFTKKEKIFPFVCFGYGCDFERKSTILDRVYSISGLSPINEINLEDGSFFFQVEKQTKEDIYLIMLEIAEESLKHYNLI